MRLANPLSLPPLTLAYLGDALYEAFVRERLLELGYVRVNDLHQHALRYVRASAQAAILGHLMPALTEQELDVVRRGETPRGTGPRSPRTRRSTPPPPASRPCWATCTWPARRRGSGSSCRPRRILSSRATNRSGTGQERAAAAWNQYQSELSGGFGA